MRQTIARADDLPPRQVGSALAQVVWHMGRRLTDQLEIAQDGVIAHAVSQQARQRTARRVGHRAITELHHVPQVERDIALSRW